MKINPILEILIVVVGSIVLGWLVKKLIFPLLYKLTRKTKWKFDDLVIESVSKWVIFWFFIGSFFYTLPIFTSLISSSSIFGRKINISPQDIKIIKTIFADPARDAVVMNVKFVKNVAGLRLFMLHNPAVGNSPMGDYGYVRAGTPSEHGLFAHQGNKKHHFVQ